MNGDRGGGWHVARLYGCPQPGSACGPLATSLEPPPPLPPLQRSHCTVGVVDGALVVSGGFDADGNELMDSEVLDRKTRRWRPRAGPDPFLKAAPAFALEARVLLHGDADDVAIIETLRVSEGGGGTGPHALRFYASYEIQTVPKQRTSDRPPPAEPKKRHPPPMPPNRNEGYASHPVYCRLQALALQSSPPTGPPTPRTLSPSPTALSTVPTTCSSSTSPGTLPTSPMAWPTALGASPRGCLQFPADMLQTA